MMRGMYRPPDKLTLNIKENLAAKERSKLWEEGTKNDKEKLDRFDLIPPDILLELAELYGIGARKYDDRNWQKGIAWGRVIRALMGHLAKWMIGEKYDKEDGQRHLISVIWCAVALAWFEKHNVGKDDRWHE